LLQLEDNAPLHKSMANAYLPDARHGISDVYLAVRDYVGTQTAAMHEAT
jgi:hypothetical protein